MKKTISNFQKIAMLLVLIAGTFYFTACQTEDTSEIEEESITETNGIQKIQGIPIDPDFSPPNIPNPPAYDAHCVVRLAYLSYLERCPESAQNVNYWINVLNTQGFDNLAAGFITSYEAGVKWNSRYHHYLNRNNIGSHQVSKLVYIAYRGLLLREPDVQGGIGWTTILNTRGILDVANGIGNSAEFQRRLSRISSECSSAASQCTF